MKTCSFIQFSCCILNKKQKRWCSYVFCDKSAILRCGNTNERFRVPLVRSLAVFLHLLSLHNFLREHPGTLLNLFGEEMKLYQLTVKFKTSYIIIDISLNTVYHVTFWCFHFLSIRIPFVPHPHPSPHPSPPDEEEAVTWLWYSCLAFTVLVSPKKNNNRVFVYDLYVFGKFQKKWNGNSWKYITVWKTSKILSLISSASELRCLTCLIYFFTSCDRAATRLNDSTR